VLSFIRSMAERGVAVLFISHNMQHVLQVADRIVVMRLGAKVAEVDGRDGTTATQLVALMTGAEVRASA
jgi:simple sugar transport system ATP-binding protein